MVTPTITDYKHVCVCVCVCGGIGGTVQCITWPCIDTVCMQDNKFTQMQDNSNPRQPLQKTCLPRGNIFIQI